MNKNGLKKKEMIKKMVEIYCKKKHGRENKNPITSLCEECEDLLLYANQRIDRCPMMATKTFCSECKIHCYKMDMREKIKEVMKFSGPRMLYHHPVLALKHMAVTIRGKLEKK